MKLTIQNDNGENLLVINYTPSQGLAADLEYAIRDHLERFHGRGFQKEAVFSACYADVYSAMAHENRVKRAARKQN